MDSMPMEILLKICNILVDDYLTGQAHLKEWRRYCYEWSADSLMTLQAIPAFKEALDYVLSKHNLKIVARNPILPRCPCIADSNYQLVDVESKLYWPCKWCPLVDAWHVNNSHAYLVLRYLTGTRTSDCHASALETDVKHIAPHSDPCGWDYIAMYNTDNTNEKKPRTTQVKVFCKQCHHVSADMVVKTTTSWWSSQIYSYIDNKRRKRTRAVAKLQRENVLDDITLDDDEHYDT
jgi:hypothetical protein